MEIEELDDIKVGNIYIYNKSNTFYKVTHLSKMKHPDTGKWINCVIYQSFKNNKIWVRSLDSFRSHFTLAM